MKKHYTFLSTLLLLFSFTATAQLQDLLNRIPAEANAVINIKSSQFTQLLSPDEFSNTLTGKKLLAFFGKNAGNELKNINDLGINYSQNAYFFRLENDSISYNCFLLPVVNAEKFASIVKTKTGIIKAGNIQSSISEDSASYLMWNSQYAMFVAASLKEYYFETEEVSKRHGLVYPPPYSYYSQATTSAYPADTIYTEDAIVSDTVVKLPADTTVIEAPPVIEDGFMQDSTYEDKYDPAYYDSVSAVNAANYEKNRNIKKGISFSLLSAYIKNSFSSQPVQSVAANQQYLASTDDKAAVTVWVKDPAALYYSYMFPSSMGSLYNPYRYDGLYNSLFGMNRNMNFGYHNLVSRMYVEENNIHVRSSLDMEEAFAASYKKIYSRKLNKKFLKYIQADSLLGYMSFSMDTKSYLEELPAMYERIYSGFMEKYSEEASIGAEFISLLLDEEAIGKMMKGDGLILLNGVYNVTTTYTDYEYDENFKSTEVQKTKNETLPKFLFMFSGDANRLVQKIINYGLKKEYMKQQGAFYEIGTKDIPFRIYFMQQDGIFFFTNSFDDIQMISAGTFKSSLSKEERKTLLASNFTMFMHPGKIANTLSASGAEVTKELTDAMNTFKGMGPLYMKTLPLKDNKAVFEAKMNVPEGEGNSLKYLFGLIDAMIEMDEKKTVKESVPQEQ